MAKRPEDKLRGWKHRMKDRRLAGLGSVLVCCAFLVSVVSCSIDPGSEGKGANLLGTSGGAVEFNLQPRVRPVKTQAIQAAAGGTIEVTETSPLLGVMLSIPAGALASDTAITIGELDNPPPLPDGFSCLGIPMDLSPDGLTFSPGAVVSIPVSRMAMSDAGLDTLASVAAFAYDKRTGAWEELAAPQVDAAQTKVTATLRHTSYLVLGARLDAPTELGFPEPGDLLYKLGSALSLLSVTDSYATEGRGWRPGHVGIYVGYRLDAQGSPYNVVEALGEGVVRHYYNPITDFSWNKINHSPPVLDRFMGARRPRQRVLLPAEREALVGFVERVADRHAPFALNGMFLAGFGLLPGGSVKGPAFNCVGLAEAAYESVGIDLVPEEYENDGIVQSALPTLEEVAGYPFLMPVWNDRNLGAGLTPPEQYKGTAPAIGDGLAPSLQWVSPANGATFTPGASTTLSAAATDADGVATIEFFANGTLVGTVACAPPSPFRTALGAPAENPSMRQGFAFGPMVPRPDEIARHSLATAQIARDGPETRVSRVSLRGAAAFTAKLDWTPAQPGTYRLGCRATDIIGHRTALVEVTVTLL